MLAILFRFPCAGATPPEPPPDVEQSEEELTAFFEARKPGAGVELRLQSGDVVRGAFAQFDDYYGRVWVNAPDADGDRRRRSIRLSHIRQARAVPSPDRLVLPAARPAGPSNAPATSGRQYQLISSDDQ